MEYIKDREFKLEKSAVCLGKFDGVHIGHRQLIKYSVEQKEQGYHPVVFTFSVNPRQRKDFSEFRQIYLENEKKVILEGMGVETVISYPFDEAMFSMDAEAFVREVLLEKVDTRMVIVGEDFRFGKGRKGDVALLTRMGEEYGFQVKAFTKVTYQGAVVSSTRIRECIKEGNLEAANAMLGSPYFVVGEVLHGRKLGRTLGMPTANIVPEEGKLLPPNGVYVSKTWIDGKEWPGISNFGVKPTVGAEEKKLVETYIFDYSGDLYGEELKVDFYAFRRAEQRFDSIKELKEQMEKDTVFGKRFVADGM